MANLTDFIIDIMKTAGLLKMAIIWLEKRTASGRSIIIMGEKNLKLTIKTDWLTENLNSIMETVFSREKVNIF